VRGTRRKSFGMVDTINFLDSVPDGWVAIEIGIWDVPSLLRSPFGGEINEWPDISTGSGGATVIL